MLRLGANEAEGLLSAEAKDGGKRTRLCFRYAAASIHGDDRR
jgi:hypothetical protein